MEKKMTKIDRWNEIAEYLRTNNMDELAQFVEAEIDLLTARKAKTAEKRAEKKAERDPMLDTIRAIVEGADHAVTAAEVLEQLDVEDMTVNKITARLTKLYNAGEIDKVSIKVEKNKRVAYVPVAAEIAE